MKGTSSKPISLLVLLIFTFENFQIVLSGKPEDVKREGSFKVDAGKALNGHVVETHHVTDPIDCIFICVANTHCLSINYKPRGSGDKGACELNNATRINDPASYKNDSSSNHYFDMEIEDSRSCLDYLRRGFTENGIYTITDNNGDSYKVWCDLSSEPGSAWTLFISMALKNRGKSIACRRSLAVSSPTNEDSPNWEAYRLSLNRMKLLASQSTHWRATTGFIHYGIDYTDYIRGNLSSFDITSFEGNGVCMDVEYVNIRGHQATATQAPFWQSDTAYFLHIDSGSISCLFKANSGIMASENNFGFYCEGDFTMNRHFRGTQNDDSTTEWWFGGYL